jgi:two-component system sensor histidine kinase DegS
MSSEGEDRALRRLARLRFDLHDGPQQDVILLAEDLRLLRAQLGPALDGNPVAPLLLGHLDDLQARLVALDGDLRRIVSLLQSPFPAGRAFAVTLTELTAGFTERTGVVPETALRGELDALSDSQQITLLAVIREALNNIREHGEATCVAIAVTAGEEQVDALVRDDGRGFDPEAALVRAARDGHLGLVGMHERVQMLGGSTRIDSCPGGPTVISVRLPAYRG